MFALGTFDVINMAVNDTLAVTGTGFQPTGLFVYGLGGSGSGGGSGTNRTTFGGASGPSNRFCSSHFDSSSASFTFITSAGMRNDALMWILADNASNGLVDLDSFDSDGFTLRCDEATPNVGLGYGYMAFGGEIQAFAGSFSEPVSSGNQNVTGVPFKPEALIIGGNRAIASLSHDSMNMLGFVGYDLAQGLWCGAADRGSSSSEGRGTYSRFGDAVAVFDINCTSIESYGQVTALNGNGFSLNWSQVSGAGTNQFWFLALRGLTAEVGPLVLPELALNDSTVSGLTRQPEACLLTGAGKITESPAGVPQSGTTSAASDGYSIGGFTSTSTLFSCGAISYHQGSFHGSDVRRSVNSRVLYFAGQGSGDRGQVFYNLQSVQADGFTVRNAFANDPAGGGRFSVFISMASGSPVADFNAPLLGTLA